MKKTLKPILTIIGIAYLIGSALLIHYLYRSTSIKDEVAKNQMNTLQNIQKFKEKRDKARQEAELIISNTIEQVNKSLPDTQVSSTDIIKASLAYVHNNSLHLIDEEHAEYRDKQDVIMQKLYEASRGNIDEKPHLSCGPRAYAMRKILDQYGMYSRLVQVYSDGFDIVRGHRMLEVYNPDRQKWEVWDPDYGVTYVNRDSGESVDILEMVFGDKSAITPEGIPGKGWENTGTDELRREFLKALHFEQDFGSRTYEFIINDALFDRQKKFADGQTFEEWALKVHGNARFIILPGDISI